MKIKNPYPYSITIPLLSFPVVLAIVFITLKVVNVISWSWWWVLSPIWMPVITCFAFGLAFLFIGLLIANLPPADVSSDTTVDTEPEVE